MRKKKIIRSLNYQPTKLVRHQIDNPFKVMTYFFIDFTIHETRDNLLELYQGWVYHSPAYADDQAIKDMLCFYIQLREFLEDSYLYTQLTKHM